jgi:hypothetical protein
MLANATSHKNLFIIILLFILMMVNWGIETFKWQQLAKDIEPTSFIKALKSVLSGLSFSLLIPNNFGDYVGRMAYMEEGNRLRSIASTIVASISQLLVTAIAGVGSLLFLRFHAWQPIIAKGNIALFWVDSILWIMCICSVMLLFVYFKLSWLAVLAEKIPFINKYRFLFKQLENLEWKALAKILLLSFMRYAVFVAQYLLMLHIFNVEIGLIDAVCTTCVMFLVLAILPTIPLADLGIRGESAVQLFGLLSSNSLGIAFTSTGIWLINLIIPSVIGSIFLLGIKVFRNR